ncbi:MAG: DUF3558 family protein [Rhodococcus sp.]|nr:DUF3558 family protein [Rhodococcus sp. (in: high G+C Gram-positive bacteria)]
MRTAPLLPTLAGVALVLSVTACASSATDVPQTQVAATSAPTWEPCEQIPSAIIAELGIDQRPPFPETRRGETISYDCGFQSDDPFLIVTATSSLESLDDRRADRRFTTIRETTLGYRDVVVSDHPGLSCHYAIGVDPGMVDVHVRYTGAGALSMPTEEACSYAERVARGFLPYLPDRLD